MNPSPTPPEFTTPLMHAFLSRLAREPAVLVSVASSQGSAPRETGAWMAVFADAQVGTIGGGHVEFEAIARANAQLAGAAPPGDGVVQRFVLGPALGQCRGGVMQLRFERVSAADAPTLASRLGNDWRRQARPVALFGGGHVGTALVRVLSTLPFALRWIDSRDSVFPAQLPTSVVCEHSDPVQAAVRDVAPQSRVPAPIAADPRRQRRCVCRADGFKTQLHDTAAALAQRGAECKALYQRVARLRSARKLRVRPCNGLKLNMSAANRADLCVGKNRHPCAGIAGCRALR